MAGNWNFLAETVTQNRVTLQLNEFKLEFVWRIKNFIGESQDGFSEIRMCVCVCARARV